MHDQATYELIERYLSGESSPEEVALVERRIAEDPEFAELLALHRELEGTMADAEALSFAAKLAAADAAYHAEKGVGEAKNEDGNGLDEGIGKGENEKKQGGENENRPLGRSRRFGWQRWAVAASIALLAVVGGYFLLRDGSLSGSEAYGKYFTAYDAPANFRGDSGAISEGYSQAFAAYNAQDWDIAIGAFREVEAADSNQITAKFYHAVALLADGDASKAIPKFQQLAATQHAFTTQSNWYLALAWLQQGDVAAARPILKLIAGGQEGKYRQQAKELLTEIGE